MVPNRLLPQHLRVPIHSLVLHLPERTQSEWTHKPNLDMFFSAVHPQPQHTMVRHPLMHAFGHKMIAIAVYYYITVSGKKNMQSSV